MTIVVTYVLVDLDKNPRFRIVVQPYNSETDYQLTADLN